MYFILIWYVRKTQTNRLIIVDLQSGGGGGTYIRRVGHMAAMLTVILNIYPTTIGKITTDILSLPCWIRITVSMRYHVGLG